MSEIDVLKRKRRRLAKSSSEELKSIDAEIEAHAKKHMVGLAEMEENIATLVKEYNATASSVGVEREIAVQVLGDEYGYCSSSEYLVRGSKHSHWFPSTEQC